MNSTKYPKNILILGCGREGLSAAHFFLGKNTSTRITLYDDKVVTNLDENIQKLLTDPRVELAHTKNLSKLIETVSSDFDLVVRSPGFPPLTIPPNLAGKLTSATQIFFDHCRGQIIGVTGTKGKSTTSSLIRDILEVGGRSVVLVGNIGKPALSELDSISSETLVVYELSSHQLIDLKSSPSVAVILGIYPEHLDYYASFEDYVNAKSAIARYQDREGHVVYDASNEFSTRIAQLSPGTKHPISRQEIKSAGRIGSKLLGDFNLHNIASALKVGEIFNISENDRQSAVRDFIPLAHRLETVGVKNGVTYVNDSLSTNPGAAIAALSALGDAVETIILGGSERNLDFSELGTKIASSKIKNIILFPPTGKRILASILKHDPQSIEKYRILETISMDEAVEFSKQYTSRSKICLLSPASPSFSVFHDYSERGEKFRLAVAALS